MHETVKKQRYRRLAAMVFSLSLLLFATLSADAFIGNKLFGKKGCVVACGRGPFGVAPLGDVITGANEMAFGPTMKSFETKGKAVVDYASVRLDEERLKLGKTIDEKLAHLTEVSQDSFGQLDTALRDNINIGLEGLTRKIHALDILGTKKTDELRLMLKGVVVLATIAALLYWIVRAIDLPKFNARVAWAAARKRVLASAALIAVLLSVSMFVAPRELPDQVRTLEADYSTYVSRMEYQRASLVAEQLRTADVRSAKYMRWEDSSAILRDIYFNPTSYMTTDGLARTEFRLLALLSKGESFKSTPSAKLTLAEDSPLELAMSMVGWQVRQDDATRMKVANIAAKVLQRPVEEQGPLRIVGLHYLRSYLQRPLHAFELAELETMAKKESQDDSPDDFSINYKIHEYGELRRILKVAEAQHYLSKDSGGKSFEQLSLESQLGFGKVVGQVYSRAIPSYVRMVDLHIRAKAAAAGAEREALIKERNEMAQSVVKAWDELLNDKYLSDAQSDLNARITLVGSIHATYFRAKQHLAQDPSAGPPKLVTSEQELDALQAEDLFHKKWLDQLSGAVKPRATKMLEYRMRYQFLADLPRLAAFEKLYADARAKPDDWKLTTPAALAAAKLGLYLCVKPTSSLPNNSLTAQSCAEPDAVPVRAMWYIRSQLTSDKPSIDSWASMLKEGLLRPIPVI